MSAFSFNPTTHISIVWGVTLAILTVLEWNSLDNDPMREQILSPFIGREVSVMTQQESLAGSVAEDALDPGLRYEVEFHFNGPLFLAYFFLPVLALRAVLWMIARARQNRLPPPQ